MADLDIAAQMGPMTASVTLLGTTRSLSIAAQMGPMDAFAQLTGTRTVNIDAQMGPMAATADLDLQRAISVNLAAQMGPMTAEVVLTEFFNTFTEYAETVADARLFNAALLCAGPGHTIAAAALGGSDIAFIQWLDPDRVYVFSAHRISGRILGIAATEQHIFVLEQVGADAADLVCYRRLFAMPEVRRERLRNAGPSWYLWGPIINRGRDPSVPTADFLVVPAGNDNVQIRSADATLAVRAASQCRIGHIGAVAVIPRADEQWSIVLVGDTGGQGCVLRYRPIAGTIPTMSGDIDITKYALGGPKYFQMEGIEGPIRALYEQTLFLHPTFDALDTERTPVLGVVARRGERVQTWTVVEDGVEVVTKTAYVGEGLANADVDWPVAVVVPATAINDYAVAAPGVFRPRSRTARIPGGYLTVHGSTGKIARHWGAAVGVDLEDELPLPGNRPPDGFQLLTPANTSTDVALQPTLTWETAAQADTYDVFLDGASIATGLAVTNYTFTTDLAYDTQYEWTVRAVNAVGDRDASEPFTFTTIPAPPEWQTTSGTFTGVEDVATLDGGRVTLVGGSAGEPVLQYSDDQGDTWSAGSYNQALGAIERLYSVASDGTIMRALAEQGGTYHLLGSTDGVVWTYIAAVPEQCTNMTYLSDLGVWVCITGVKVFTSTDGNTFFDRGEIPEAGSAALPPGIGLSGGIVSDGTNIVLLGIDRSTHDEMGGTQDIVLFTLPPVVGGYGMTVIATGQDYNGWIPGSLTKTPLGYVAAPNASDTWPLRPAYVSVDEGATWAFDETLAGQDRLTLLYAAGATVLSEFFSLDSGETWEVIAGAAPTGRRIVYNALDAVFYSPRDNGVWRLPNPGL